MTAEAHVLLLASASSAAEGTRSAPAAVSHVVALHANAPLLWDGRRWTLMNLGDIMTTLLPEVGPPLQIDTRFFVHLVDTRTAIPGGQ